MSRSKPLMNPGTLSSLRAASMDVKRSRISRCGSARSASPPKTTQAKSPAPHLCAIAAIDLDVLFGQVARPETRASSTFALDDEFDQALVTVELFFQLIFREIGGHSALANRDALHVDVDFVWVEGNAGVSRRR